MQESGQTPGLTDGTTRETGWEPPDPVGTTIRPARDGRTGRSGINVKGSLPTHLVVYPLGNRNISGHLTEIHVVAPELSQRGD